jgi:hypothetical protein
LVLEDIRLWKDYRGQWCSACIAGKMTERNRVSSTKDNSIEPGQERAADILSIERADGNKKPIFNCTDVGSKCRILVDMGEKSVANLL